jgi:hypothetical protein
VPTVVATTATRVRRDTLLALLAVAAAALGAALVQPWIPSPVGRRLAGARVTLAAVAVSLLVTAAMIELLV